MFSTTFFSAPMMAFLNSFVLETSDSSLTNLGTVFTQIGTWLSSIVSTITGSPILLIGLGIFVFGAVIGLAYRLIRG